ncbi:MAG: hypothetical protein WKF73_10255 [Nocardioidaceae bacterium]
MKNVAAGEILQAVRNHLASYGLTFTHDRLELTSDPGMWKGTMQFGDSQALVRVVLVAPMTLTALARLEIDDQYLSSPYLRTLVVGQHVHERSADAFRKMGIAYADTAGNAYIRYATVVIDVRGRRPRNLTIDPRSLTTTHGDSNPATSLAPGVRRSLPRCSPGRG